MSRYEVVDEPAPKPRKSGKLIMEGAIQARFIDEKSGREVACRRSPRFYENERRLREARKY